ncbi:aminotransferase class V-fold PLP-dependent enzyme [Alkalilimnicola ehrlichii]|uniref:cysteine desulfurase n=1 Tax=Alkalilimnicola ehrlichii TaxID=351052 RepID=A0A3E0X0Y7_9GAMM|nr:aminotransferase class V-fold PLP-dependent enzyme [Alkalilimnicola ehrlichii]RFA38091.1 IscS subfamily cysteine desulfurase [Alkalilimnicola ehrlichii]
MASDTVYLDYAATTPLDPRVAEAMAMCLQRSGAFANPASQHEPGLQAAALVERARAHVAALIKADPAEIVWTSCATESNNLAIKGAARFYKQRRGRHIVTVRTEHKSVLEACIALEAEGFDIEFLETGAEGRVTVEQLQKTLREDTVLVSIMHANNETGVVQDIERLAPIVKANGSLLHVDAVQSAGRLTLDMQQWPVDLLSLSAHKLYGPKGVGALYVRARPRVRLQALLHGGDQEGRLRPGTVPTHQVVGMGEAYRLAAEEAEADNRRTAALKQRLWHRLVELDGVFRNGAEDACAPHIINLAFAGVHGEALAAELQGLAVASGSACTSASAAPSHVLRAMGVPDQLAHSSLRFSFGRFSTEQDVDDAVEIVRAGVERLRRFSPIWRAYRNGEALATLYDRAG